LADNKNNSLIQIMVVLIAAFLGFAIISSLFGGGMMGGGMMGGMGFGWLFMLLPLFFVIFIIYALLDRGRPAYDQSQYPPQYQPPYQDSGNPILVLEQRYASGELSREDFLRMRDDINRG
jgi:uncharacterized membrane protein